MILLASLLSGLAGIFRSRADLQLENLALRHQLAVLRRTSPGPRLRPFDRILWALLSRTWSGWWDALVIVQPENVIAWRRRRFREYWAKLSRSGKPGRPAIPKEIREFIRRMSLANPLWGAPHIVAELKKIGITLSRSTVAKYMVRHRKPPSQTWRSFLKNHVRDIVAVDFFIVPIVKSQIRVVFLILAHERRRVLHFNITTNPTAEWTAQQIVEAFPWDSAPRYLLRDRDKICGAFFQRRVKSMGIELVVTAPRSPWHKGYASHYTSFVGFDKMSGNLRRLESFLPCSLTGGSSPGCSYRHSFLSL